MTARIAATSKKCREASPQSWLCSFLGRGFLLRARENLKRLVRMFFVLVSMLIFAPGSLLASWEVPTRELAVPQDHELATDAVLFVDPSPR